MRKPEFDKAAGIGLQRDSKSSGLSNLSLYMTVVLIWGSTWLAIKFQLGVVPPAASIAWRFAIAGLTLLGYALWKGLPLRFGIREHMWLALESVSMFGFNYVGVYIAEEHLTSGLVAVVYSLMAFLNLAFMRLFYKAPILPRHAAGACLGIAGVVMVFWPEVSSISMTDAERLGLLYALGSVVIASLGTIVATRNQRAGMPIVQVHGWAMLYGAIAIAVYAVLTGDRLSFDWSLSYVLSLLYLALLGSVVAFDAYITLMGRIGAGRVGYASVAIPIVAVLLSTLFEDLQWQFAMVIGIGLCFAGNWLVLSPRRP